MKKGILILFSFLLLVACDEDRIISAKIEKKTSILINDSLVEITNYFLRAAMMNGNSYDILVDKKTFDESKVGDKINKLR